MDLMIDLETLGTQAKAPIISIGAVFFDKKTFAKGATFYAVLDVAHQMDVMKRIPDASTIKWWMQQEGAAKKVFQDGFSDTKKALELFSQFATQHGIKSLKVWGNGSTFDIVLLEDLMKDYGIKVPWLFYNVRDLRTFREYIANNQKIPRAIGTHHNALDDAVVQADFVLDALRSVAKPKEG